MPRKLKTSRPAARRRTGSSNGRPTKAKSSRPLPEEPGSLEGEIVTLARTGKLAKAGRRAVAASKKLGLPVTYKRGDEIIKQFPNGDEEVLGTVQRLGYVLPHGIRVIRK